MIHLKLAKAVALLEEVDVHMIHKFYTTAINRLYYSCFHATNALLLTEDLIAKTHSGVASLLDQHFVRNDRFDIEQASFFSRLMKERIDDDYSDFLIRSEDEVLEFMAPAKRCVAYVSDLISVYFETIAMASPSWITMFSSQVRSVADA